MNGSTGGRGSTATHAVAERYGLEVESRPWYDAVSPTGTKYEVKATSRALADGSTGRFRLWEEQHRSLTASDAQGTSWYAFVLLSQSGDVRRIQRRKPSTVTRLVNERGGWYDAGHEGKDGRQFKLAHDAVF
ncbi:hypothetical protein LPA44_04160 [Halobacterium sp. KA-4]|uniref:hypothetical protein n=1 Tax=Halobacterium sp. KA-4 TaxID=2896367 RepID=UPI001E587C00|nr:hypothetical protein [Halobacterium sp. KA-4]MCD2199093.1 hypothetical protein [Halobacterium sp. KA-4]